MEIADTNVIVGIVTGMTDAHWAIVGPVLREAEDSEQPVLLTEGVLVEAEWVLRRRHGFARREIAGIVQGLVDSASFEAWDPRLATLALRIMAEEPRLDIVDCLLAARDVLGEGTVVTLDRLLARTIAEQYREGLGG